MTDNSFFSSLSSIRVFILGSLAERGEMHGHQLLLLVEQEHIHLWTDFTVGGIYGAIKRLAAEDLIAGVRVEREGNRPNARCTTSPRRAAPR